MKFLIDAQLPRRLAFHLRIAGHQAIHILDLPPGNRTSDAVVTKDADFVESFIISRQPPKLLLISTGNITNGELEALLRLQFATIATEFKSHNFLELTRHALVVHE
jgi:predicted nuclease of predicted toxin-antitoxin system